MQVGSFGSVLRFASFPKSRKDMFDVATAGPLLGWALSLGAFALGTTSYYTLRSAVSQRKKKTKNALPCVARPTNNIPPPTTTNDHHLGMAMTQGAAPEVAADWPMLPVGLFRSSLLLWQIGQALYSADVVNLPLVNMIHVHPLAVRVAVRNWRAPCVPPSN